MDNKKFSDTEIYKLHAFIMRMDKEAEQLLKEQTRLSYMDFLILMGVDEHPDYTQQQIAHHMNLTKSAVSKRIERLVQRKLLGREENPDNRRENIIRLTKVGTERLDKSYSILTSNAELKFESLGKDRRKFGQILDNMLKQLKHSS